MQKLLVFFLVCLALGLALAGRDKGRSHYKEKGPLHFEQDPSRISRKLSKFCSDNTIAQAYLTQILSAINTFEGNSSYTSILQTRSVNFITYLKDTANQELLRTDCAAFIKGLQAAKNADKQVERTQKQLASKIRKQFKQIARDVTKGKGFIELDS